MHFDRKLCILFLYHRCDELTVHHLDLVRRSNHDAAIIPLTDTVPAHLPGTIDVGATQSTWITEPKWASIDTTLYRWFETRNLNAKWYIVLEYDCACTVDLLSYYAPVLNADVGGIDFFTRAQNPGWKWFAPDALRKLPPEQRSFAAGIVPFTCLLFTHDALDAIIRNAFRGDCFCELRLGTTINMLGLRFSPLPPDRAATIAWHSLPWMMNRPGLFHAVKTLGHNVGRRNQPNPFMSRVFCSLRRRSPDRELLPFIYSAKKRALRRKLFREVDNSVLSHPTEL